MKRLALMVVVVVAVAGVASSAAVALPGVPGPTRPDRGQKPVSSGWKLESSPAPAGVESPTLGAISCVSTSFCAATGNSGSGEPPQNANAFTQTSTGANWAAATPPQAAGLSLSGVSCVDPSFCVAVGARASAGAPASSLPEHAAVLGWNGTTWAAQQVPLPAGDSDLRGVSCASATFCVAVGNHGKSPWTQPLTEVWNGGGWRIVKTPAVGGRGGSLQTVTCLSSSWCMVLGEYFKGHLGPYRDIPRTQWVAQRFNGHRWTVQHPAAINDRPGLGPDPWNFVTAVACTSRRTCLGVGYIPLTQGDESPTPFAVRWNGRAWSAALKGLPRFAQPSGVACNGAGSGRCFAVGQVFGSAELSETSQAPLVLRWKTNRWATMSTPRIPAQGGQRQHGGLAGISCVHGGGCRAVGYRPRGTGTTTLVESGP